MLPWSETMRRNTPEKSDPGPKRAGGRFAYDGLERVIHEKARLSILSSLAAHPDGLIFTELKSRPHRREFEPANPISSGIRIRRSLEGIRQQPSANPLPALQKGPGAFSRIHFRAARRDFRRPDDLPKNQPP
jgi:hypothetical protein